MGKKTTATSKVLATQKRAAKPTIKTRTVAAPPEVIEAPKVKPVALKPARRSTPKKKELSFTNDDVALRAYFIAEKRNSAGLAGNAHQDWIEAERQLTAEAAVARKAKTKSKPKPKTKAKARKKAA